MLFLLCGCSSYEYHGHYKFDASKISNGMKKGEVIEEFGVPLYMPFSKDVMYYFYSKNIVNSFGLDRMHEAKILRIELEDDIVISHEVFDFQDYEAEKARTKEPHIQIKILSELMDGIENMKSMEDAVKESRNFISLDSNS